MLHLLPLRYIWRFALGVTALGVLAVVVLDSPQQGTTLAKVTTIVRWMLFVEAGLAIFILYFWYFIPGLTARWLFPHIDGSWDGRLNFKRKVTEASSTEAKVVPDSKAAQLHVHQSLTRIRLILETDESTSETLVVKPERDPDFSRFRLFYIFENRSRDGLPNNARSYRGTAVMEVQPGEPSTLMGTYFTDQGSEGTFRFERRSATHKGLPALWNAITGAKGAASPVCPEPRDERALNLASDDEPAETYQSTTKMPAQDSVA